MLWLSKMFEKRSIKYTLARDPERAFLLAQKLAACGSRDGLARLAHCHEHGVGTEKNRALAARLYLYAEAHGTGSCSDLTKETILPSRVTAAVNKVNKKQAFLYNLKLISAISTVKFWRPAYWSPYLRDLPGANSISA